MGTEYLVITAPLQLSNTGVVVRTSAPNLIFIDIERSIVDFFVKDAVCLLKVLDNEVILLREHSVDYVCWKTNNPKNSK